MKTELVSNIPVYILVYKNKIPNFLKNQEAASLS